MGSMDIESQGQAEAAQHPPSLTTLCTDARNLLFPAEAHACPPASVGNC